MNPSTSNLFRVTLCVIFLLLAVATASAQFRASVQGTVSDATGALVPDATVTLTSQETGRKQEAKTSGEGFYRLSELSPGRYTL
ncbi:MAG TPA: carboxypeptidase-like regulatory domain-containing protein, partial [Pyrinomonadaceae bacterium]|nr:carboxypeptidase-like regulatory domain-containing protein [Pyrinomonadaceae bacterium]